MLASCNELKCSLIYLGEDLYIKNEKKIAERYERKYK